MTSGLNVTKNKKSIYFATTPKRVTDRFFCYYCSRNTNQFRIQTNKLTWKLKCKNYSSVYLHCLIMTVFGVSVVRVTDLVCVRDLYTYNKCNTILCIFYPGDIQKLFGRNFSRGITMQDHCLRIIHCNYIVIINSFSFS